MRVALVLVVAAGCGFQINGGSAADDVPPGDGGIDMADGEILPDMPIDMGNPNIDTDGDGIRDNADNCPMIANADQRNHDGDPFGDACDHCPHLLSATDPDDDEDGVGDACDPRPSNSADRRVLWEGFYDGTNTATWTGVGLWMVSGGFMRQTGTTQAGMAPLPNVNRAFVMTELVLDTSANGDIGLAVQSSTSANRFECTLTKNGSNVNVRARIGGSTSQATWPGTFAVDSHVTLTLDLTNGTGCRAQQDANDISQTASTSADPTGRTYIGMSGMAGRFDYLFVVDEEP